MDQSLSITPPPELVQQWTTEYTKTKPNCLGTEFVAARAAQWGWDQREPEIQAVADQELEACCEWLDREGWSGESRQLRAARRPKPPSLKEQALMALEDGDTGPGASLTSNEVSIIRRALEALPDD
jgi:hypothetical protein